MAQASNLFHTPVLEYFTSGNDFTGSVGTFRFKLQPKEEELLTFVYSDMAFEFAEIYSQSQFPLTEEGLTQAIAWLEATYQTRH